MRFEEVILLDDLDLSKLKNKELEENIKVVGRTLKQRVKRLKEFEQSNGFKVPSLSGKNIKNISTATKGLSRNEKLSKLTSMVRFANLKTSSVQKTKKFYNEVMNKNGMFFKNVEDRKKFFEIYNRMEKDGSLPSASNLGIENSDKAMQLIYKLYSNEGEISLNIKNKKDNVNYHSVNKLKKDLEYIYEKVQEGEEPFKVVENNKLFKNDLNKINELEKLEKIF